MSRYHITSIHFDRASQDFQQAKKDMRRKG